MMRSLSAGVSRAKIVVCSTASASALSLISATCVPSITTSQGSPTCVQIVRVTSSLSPVRIFTATPWSRSAAMAGPPGPLRGLKEAPEAPQHHLGFVVARVTLLGRHIPIRHAQHTEAILAQGVELLAEVFGKSRRRPQHLTFGLEGGAPPQ